jgi:sigma-B regulation protein RsbU (phosphoserine phosphatase)
MSPKVGIAQGPLIVSFDGPHGPPKRNETFGAVLPSRSAESQVAQTGVPGDGSSSLGWRRSAAHSWVLRGHGRIRPRYANRKLGLQNLNGENVDQKGIPVPTLEAGFLQSQLEERKRRLELAAGSASRNSELVGLLHEVDAALDRIAEGTYGLCLECHESVEPDRLLADPLVRYCLDHLTQPERAALQRDLDLASQVQRNLLPPNGLRVGGWETSYHFAPVGAVSGDYCDLIASDGQLLFLLGDVSGKGVAASMIMAQLHALFRTLTGMSLLLGQIVAHVNRVLCESALAGQFATLVCGLAKPTGEVEIHNAGHCPAIVAGRDGVFCIESTGLPLGMFVETKSSATCVQMEFGDTLFLYTDGLSEARNENDEYGVDRVMTLVRQQAAQQPAELIAACIDDLRAFVNGGPSFDDMTVLAVRRCA